MVGPRFCKKNLLDYKKELVNLLQNIFYRIGSWSSSHKEISEHIYSLFCKQDHFEGHHNTGHDDTRHNVTKYTITILNIITHSIECCYAECCYAILDPQVEYRIFLLLCWVIIFLLCWVALRWVSSCCLSLFKAKYVECCCD